MAASATCVFHQGHSLTEHHYHGGESCALCERIIAGAGYRCGECGGFDVHGPCLSLPMRVAFDQHPAHALQLSLLTAASRRRCDACGVISHAECCMYRCVACGFDVHPRCTTLLDGEHQQHCRERGVAKRVGK